MKKVLFLSFLILFFNYNVMANEIYDRAFYYLNNITNFKAKFLQSNPDGSIQSGMIVISKPGLMKWDYDPPTPVTILIKNNWLTYYDRTLDEYNYSAINNVLYDLLSKNDLKNLKNVKFLTIEHTDKTVKITAKDLETNTVISIILNKNPIYLSKLNVYSELEEVTKFEFYDINYNDINKNDFTINKLLY